MSVDVKTWGVTRCTGEPPWTSAPGRPRTHVTGARGAVPALTGMAHIIVSRSRPCQPRWGDPGGASAPPRRLRPAQPDPGLEGRRGVEIGVRRPPDAEPIDEFAAEPSGDQREA